MAQTKRLTISTKSWHYRFMNYVLQGVMPRDLCEYLRDFAFASIAVVFLTLGPFNTFITIGLAGDEWLFRTHTEEIIVNGEIVTSDPKQMPTGWLIGSVVFAGVVCFIDIGIMVRFMYNRGWFDREEKEEKPKPKPEVKQEKRSLLKEAYKAWKTRTCPLLEYKREVKEDV